MTNDDELAALGSRVRALRKAAGLTQEELASRAELSANYIGEVERGKRNPSVTSLIAIASGLGVGLASLF